MNSDTRVKHVSFLVPLNTISFSITAAITKQKACHNMPIYGFARPHGVPYANPLNSIIEPPLLTHEKELFPFVINVSSHQLDDVLIVNRPLSGTWYASIFSKPDFSGIICSFTVHLLVTMKYVTDAMFMGMAPIQPNSTLNSQSQLQLTLKPNEGRFINIPSRWFVRSGSIRISRCRILPSGTSITNMSQCPVGLAVDPERMPDPLNLTCCELTVNRLNGANSNAVLFVKSNLENSSSVEFQLDVSESSISGFNGTGSPDKYGCYIDSLMNHETYNLAFGSKFSYDRLYFNQQLELLVVPNSMFVFPMFVRNGLDTGGSMLVTISLGKPKSDQNRNITVLACFTRNGILSAEDLENIDIKNATHCPYAFDPLRMGESVNIYSELLLPYPQYGQWSLQILVLCRSSNDSVLCNGFIPSNKVLLKVRAYTGQCHVLSDCGEYGSCQMIMSHSLVLSACKCPTGYAGFGCTQMTHLPSSYAPLRDILLLTLSNIVFVIAFGIALYHKLIFPAIVYLYVLIFSSLYHACDTNYAIAYCVLSREVLSFCDFYGAVMAIWVTILSMAWLPGFVEAGLVVVMSLVVVIGVIKERTSILLYIFPIVIGLLILICSWGFIIYRRRRIFPPWRWYLLHLTPGIFIATVGGATFYVGGKYPLSYPFIHSVWHFTIALSVCFLLPQPVKWQRLFRWPVVVGFYLDVNGEFLRSKSSSKNGGAVMVDQESQQHSSSETRMLDINETDDCERDRGHTSHRTSNSDLRNRNTLDNNLSVLNSHQVPGPNEIPSERRRSPNHHDDDESNTFPNTEEDHGSSLLCDDLTFKETLRSIYADLQRVLSLCRGKPVSQGNIE
jgi:hypothetical protein